MADLLRDLESLRLRALSLGASCDPRRPAEREAAVQLESAAGRIQRAANCLRGAVTISRTVRVDAAEVQAWIALGWQLSHYEDGAERRTAVLDWTADGAPVEPVRAPVMS